MYDDVLIFSMGEVIGDGLIKLPFVAGLRSAFPQSRIVWCAAKGDTVYASSLGPVVAGLIDEVVTGPPPTGAGAFDWMSFASPLGGRKFDLVIDTQNQVLRSLAARRLARKTFVSAAFSADASMGPVTERLERLLQKAAGPAARLQPLSLQSQRARAAAEAILPQGPTYIGLAPGAGGVAKRWPLERYIALAQRQSALGRTPVIFAGPQEAEMIDAFLTEVAGCVLPEWRRSDDFQDIAGPLLVIALAQRLAAAVANDAGPGHMLAAGGAPLASLQIDRRKAQKFRPAAPRLEVLIAEDFGAAGMAALPLDAVLTAVERLLKGSPS